MTYELIIGDRSFSSWSLRGWLMFEKFDIPFRIKMAGLYSGTLQQDLAAFAPARYVPAIRLPGGDIVGDTLAIAETLAERHPDAGLWPDDPSARVLARWMVAEMHSGFTGLRNECPMQLVHQFQDFEPSETVLQDLERIQEFWALARSVHGQAGPWLFGEYSLADVFFAPVAARISGYNLPITPQAAEYVDLHLRDLAFRRWRAMGATKTYDPFPYGKGLARGTWPGPAPMQAEICEGPGENPTCPYSGDPSEDFLKINGRIFGFCNPFCRDKTLHDPEAWPKFMDIYHS